MFSYINGKITEISSNAVTLEANGIGYELTVTASTLSEISLSRDAKIYIYMNVREDGVALFGFSSKIEKSMFLRLISVSGIGPKVAINILSGIALGELSRAVSSSDTHRLSALKGVGKKTAERIILELKDKIDAEISVDLGKNNSIMTDRVLKNSDAIETLVSLGYTKAEAAAAINKHYQEGMTTEQIVFAALKG